MTTIHAMTSFFFGFISLFCCLMLLVSEERKLNAFITDYTNLQECQICSFCSVSKVMWGKICALPLDFVINEPANQFDFQFENVFLFFSQYSLVQTWII